MAGVNLPGGGVPLGVPSQAEQLQAMSFSLMRDVLVPELPVETRDAEGNVVEENRRINIIANIASSLERIADAMEQEVALLRGVDLVEGDDEETVELSS